MEPTEEDIKTAGVNRRVVKGAMRKIARLRKQKARLIAALPRARRLLVLAERPCGSSIRRIRKPDGIGTGGGHCAEVR
jgi:hypothetical protein